MLAAYEELTSPSCLAHELEALITGFDGLGLQLKYTTSPRDVIGICTRLSHGSVLTKDLTIRAA